MESDHIYPKALIVADDMMDVYGLFYGLTADGYDYTEKERYAKLIRRELLTVVFFSSLFLCLCTQRKTKK